MLALLFPGQGSQRPAMGASWQNHPSWAIVARLEEATGRDVSRLLIDADAEELRQTSNAQLAAFALGLVILDATGAVPGAVAGHSLGEYTALVASGVLSPEAGAGLVAARAAAMQAAADANPGTMAAVLGLDAEALAAAVEPIEGVWLANDNAPGQIVLAGTHDGVETAGRKAKAVGAKRVMDLPVGGAFHSPLMAPAQAPLDEALRGAVFAPAPGPVVANVDATAHTEGWAGLLSAQLVSPVRWRESLIALTGLGVTHFLELGAGTELSGMVKRTVDGAVRASVAKPDDLASLPDFLKEAAR